MKWIKEIYYEANIIKQILNDAEKCFNREEFFYTNQQLLGFREVFIRFIVKEWVYLPCESIGYDK